MKVLLLVQDEQRIILDNFYQDIANQFDYCKVLRLTSDEQANLKKYFNQNIVTSEYDRIILFLRFKKEIKQVRFLRTIPNLVFLEHDAYQNYAPSKYQGVFSKHYSMIPWVRVLCSGHKVTRKLQSEGVDAVFVPKAYDGKQIFNQGEKRDIELGFIGSLKSTAYSKRKELLEQLQQSENLLITRTKSGQEYVDTLNRIRFFVSADVGMGEYMIKNFEAMAAGCVLFAWSQGKEENKALGFVDMENVVLYTSLDELRKKLNLLRSNPEHCKQIAIHGQVLAETRYTYTQVAQQLKNALICSLRKPVINSLFFFRKYSYTEPSQI